MKLLFDLFPIIIFFAVYKIGGMNEAQAHALASSLAGPFMADGGLKLDQGAIMLATMAAIVASIIQVGYLKIRGLKVDLMLWVAFGVIVIFGGLTIYFHNAAFIKWKPTIIYWLQAGAALIALMFFKKNLIRQVMETQIKLPDDVWDRLCLAWIAFFFIVGGLNLLAAFVIFADNEAAWVNFKVFGLTALLFVFIIGQTMYLTKYMEEEKA
jgi:intracellular septation protein